MSEVQKLILALPSKGRMMADSAIVLAKAGLAVTKSDDGRGYQGVMPGQPDVEVQYVSAAEIAGRLRSGAIHLGITGADLVHDASAALDNRVRSAKKLGFGRADVVVAVPAYWLDVNRMADLEVMAMAFRRRTGRRVRVATKYLNSTRRFFAKQGVASYRIVESLGATEGAPSAGLAELIVDITSTGATLKANGLRILDDGILLRSEANLFVSEAATWTEPLRQLSDALLLKMRTQP
jgi:ATP phosphoribosyltransferase